MLSFKLSEWSAWELAITPKCKFDINKVFCFLHHLSLPHQLLSLDFDKDCIVEDNSTLTFLSPIPHPFLPWAAIKLYMADNKEEKSLRHVAMVAKFLDDNKTKTSLRSELALFHTTSILFTFTFF